MLKHHAYVAAQLGQIGFGVVQGNAINGNFTFLKRLKRVDGLIRVDLPEPDGPHTTTTSPLLMEVEQLLSTCTEQYHLLTFFS